MKNSQLFTKYRKKMIAEGVLKSVLCGFSCGFAVNALVALISFLCGFDAGLWLAVGLGVGCAVACGALFYFLKFRPSDREIARRVDALGFDERMITMLELNGDDSYIARRQREDAQAHIAKASAGLLKFRVPAVMIAAIAVCGACGITFTTVEALAVYDMISDVPEIVNPEFETYLEIRYVAGEGGEIEGEFEQLIEFGMNPEPVMAVANDGYTFVGWDDGQEDPYRDDAGITESNVFTALFEAIEQGDNAVAGDPNEPGGDGEGGDDADDKPVNGGNSDDDANQGGGGGESGGGENNDPNQGGNETPGGDGTGDGANAGGRYDPGNQIIDGETYYRNDLEAYLQEVMELLASDQELTPEEKALIEKYFNSL